MKITEHLPPKETAAFETTQQLLEIGFVKSHSRQAHFYRYSLNRPQDGYNRTPLLAEYEEGARWIVIGFIEGDTSRLELPDWKG